MQIAAKLNHLLAMAGWAKPATSTTEGEEILKVAIGAVYTCETLFKLPYPFCLSSPFLLTDEIFTITDCKIGVDDG